MFNSESFLTILKTSDNVDELQAVKEKVDLDIARQRSKDTGGDDGWFATRNLHFLSVVSSLCLTRKFQELYGFVSEALRIDVNSCI